MKVTVEQYGDICDVVYRASQNWPLIPDDANPFHHTSDVARAATNRILGILGLEAAAGHEDWCNFALYGTGNICNCQS